MTFNRKRQLVGWNTRAIIYDGNASDAACFQTYVDCLRLRIDRVLHKFFEHRGRPLNDLAGSDLADQTIG
jgi:hypothetical protein